MTGIQNLSVRIISFLLCVLCAVSMLQPVIATQTLTEDNRTLTTLVRMEAKKTGFVVGQIENGTMVTVLGEKNGFYKVDCYDMSGYVAKSQIVHTQDDEYYITCVDSSSETRSFLYTEHAKALEMRTSLLELAKKQLGSRYVYGGERPGAFDCSGFTYYLYKEHAISLFRRASQQLGNGIIVPKEAMQVGDLVFFRQTGNYPADHVGIYVGNDQVIHASTKRGIEYASLNEGYCKDYFLCARRIVVTDGVSPAPVVQGRSVSSPLTVNSISGRTA